MKLNFFLSNEVHNTKCMVDIILKTNSNNKHILHFFRFKSENIFLILTRYRMKEYENNRVEKSVAVVCYACSQ
jgi:hypothetical protein